MTASALVDGGPAARVERAYPTLDGLRLLAATAVVITHTGFATGHYTSDAFGGLVKNAQAGGPAPMTRQQIVDAAQQYMNVPYVWGGNSASGLDCSAFVSKAWGVSRHTTDNLSAVSRKISKDDLQTGDALNLTTAADDDGAGHVRMFDKWANSEHTKMWVYEETPPRSVHHIINWDPSYTPMRRLNVLD